MTYFLWDWMGWSREARKPSLEKTIPKAFGAALEGRGRLARRARRNKARKSSLEKRSQSGLERSDKN